MIDFLLILNLVLNLGLVVVLYRGQDTRFINSVAGQRGLKFRYGGNEVFAHCITKLKAASPQGPHAFPSQESLFNVGSKACVELNSKPCQKKTSLHPWLAVQPVLAIKRAFNVTRDT